MTSKTLGITVIAGTLILLSAGAFGCELAFVLTDSKGSSLSIVPGKTVSLKQGETYSLLIRLREDHNNCKVAPEETQFLLEEEKWKSSKDYLPLQLLGEINWTDTGTRTHETEVSFKTAIPGNWELEVLRECTKKEGYDEYLLFSVS